MMKYHIVNAFCRSSDGGACFGRNTYRILIPCMLIFIFISAFFISMMAPCRGDSVDKDYRLYSDAIQLLKETIDAEQVSYGEAYKLYAEALHKLDQVISDYPSSSTAEKLRNGELKVGLYTYTECKNTFLRIAQLKAEAEEDPTTCALLIWEKTYRDEGLGLVMIAEAYAGNGKVRKALALVKTDDSPLMRAWALERVVKQCAESGDYEKALEIAHSIERTSDDNKDFIEEKLAMAFAWIAAGLEKSGNMQEASKALSFAFESMAKKALIYGALSSVYRDEGLYARSFEWAIKMDDENLRDKELEWLFKSHIERKAPERAFEVANVLHSPSKKAHALAQIATNYMEKGQKEKSSLLLKQALASAKSIKDPSKRSELFLELALLCGNSMMKRTALDALSCSLASAREVKEKEQGEKGIEDIALAYFRLGEEKWAIDIARSLKGNAERHAALEQIALAYAETGRCDAALSIVTAEDDASTMYETMALIFTRTGLFYENRHEIECASRYYSKAQDMALRVGTAPLRENALNSMAFLCAKHRRYDRALRIANLAHDHEARRRCMSTVAMSCEHNRDYEKAIEILNQLGTINSAGLASIAMCYSSEGNPKRAFEIARKIEEPFRFGSASVALCQIAKKYSAMGDCEEVLEVIERIKDPYSKIIALTEIAINYRTARKAVGKKGRQALHNIIRDLDI
jgi:tetratricopeptide (TPR) repeat protein